MTASGPATRSPARDYGRIRHACSRARGAGCGKNSPIPTRAQSGCVATWPKAGVAPALASRAEDHARSIAFLRAQSLAATFARPIPNWCFLRLNAGKPLPSKKSEDGIPFAARCSSGKGSGHRQMADRRTHRYRCETRRRARRLRRGDCRARRRRLCSGRHAAARRSRPADADLVRRRRSVGLPCRNDRLNCSSSPGWSTASATSRARRPRFPPVPNIRCRRGCVSVRRRCRAGRRACERPASTSHR